MLAFDHAANFIEHLDHTFIVGDKQGSQDCFEIINSLRPRTGLECKMTSKLDYKIVDDVSFSSCLPCALKHPLRWLAFQRVTR